jgi:sec-independent protein translocase protein TatB
MFGDVGFGELIGLAILALVLVGPDRLPSFAADAAKLIKKIRSYALSATDQIKDSLGTVYENLKPEDLHPKNFIKKQLNEALADEPKKQNKLNGKAKLDPEML